MRKVDAIRGRARADAKAAQDVALADHKDRLTRALNPTETAGPKAIQVRRHKKPFLQRLLLQPKPRGIPNRSEDVMSSMPEAAPTRALRKSGWSDGGARDHCSEAEIERRVSARLAWRRCKLARAGGALPSISPRPGATGVRARLARQRRRLWSEVLLFLMRVRLLLQRSDPIPSEYPFPDSVVADASVEESPVGCLRSPSGPDRMLHMSGDA